MNDKRVVLRVFECGDCKFTFMWVNEHTPNFCPVCSLSPVWEQKVDAYAYLSTVFNNGHDEAEPMSETERLEAQWDIDDARSGD